MVIISGNTGSATLIDPELIQDRGSDGSIWSEKESSDPNSDAKSDANCVRCEADRTPDEVKRRLESFTQRSQGASLGDSLLSIKPAHHLFSHTRWTHMEPSSQLLC